MRNVSAIASRLGVVSAVAIVATVGMSVTADASNAGSTYSCTVEASSHGGNFNPCTTLDTTQVLAPSDIVPISGEMQPEGAN